MNNAFSALALAMKDAVAALFKHTPAPFTHDVSVQAAECALEYVLIALAREFTAASRAVCAGQMDAVGRHLRDMRAYTQILVTQYRRLVAAMPTPS